MDAIYPAYGRQRFLDLHVAGIPEPTLLQVTGTATNGSPTITAVADTSDVVVGASAGGVTQFPTTLMTVVSKTSSTITFSQNANGSGASIVNIARYLESEGLQGAAIRLYKNTISPTPATTLAELEAEEADYTGYAAQELEMDTGVIDGAGNEVAESQLLIWQPTGTAVAATIAGLWADDGTGALIIWPLPGNVTLDGPTKVLKNMVLEKFLPPGSAVQVLP